MDNSRLWNVIQEAWSALALKFEPLVEQECVARGFDQRTWGLMLAVLTFEPEDTTPGHFLVRSPYSAAEAYMTRLKSAAGLGMLAEIDPGRFQVTEAGRKSTLDIAAAVREAMEQMDPLLPADAGRLAVLIERLVQNCLETPSPPEPWSIRLSKKLMPNLNPPMPFIEQGFSCLSAYRDDAHLAAWQRSNLSAMALETLTLFWRGEVTSLDELCEKLAFRGHSTQTYRHVLLDLRDLGLITGPDQAPWVTGKGRVVRNEIEADTDRFFFAPWTCLTGDEKLETLDLVSRMRDGLG